MQPILIKDRLFKLPNCYNEATPQQIQTITKLNLKKLSDSVYRVLLFLALLPAKGTFWMRFKWFFKGKRGDFMLEIDEFGPEIDTFLNATEPFYVQKFPLLKWNKWGRTTLKRLYGPGDMLDGVVFRQFRLAEEYSFHYQQTREMDSLNRLIAVLYLPSTYDYFWCVPNPDQRLIVFEEKRMKQRMQLIESLPFDLKISIFLWYKGSRTMISQQFARIFLRGSKGSASGADISANDIAESWANLLDGLAETAPNYNAWDATGLYDVLHNYEKRLLEQDRMKEMRANQPN